VLISGKNPVILSKKFLVPLCLCGKRINQKRWGHYKNRKR
jgi:hypothetical protein